MQKGILNTYTCSARLSRFSTRRNIPRAAESLLFFIEFRQKRTLKSRIKFNFSAAENSENQSYFSLCLSRDQNNSRSVRMIPSSEKPALSKPICTTHGVVTSSRGKCPTNERTVSVTVRCAEGFTNLNIAMETKQLFQEIVSILIIYVQSNVL